MWRHVARFSGPLAVLALMLLAAPTAFAGDPCYHGFEVPPRSTAADTQIKVAPCAFAPTVAYVAPGATVTFFNGPGFTHLITGANQEWGSRDVELAPEQKVSYRFDKPGVYPYACALHRGMSGAIVVGALSQSQVGETTAGGSTASAPTSAETEKQRQPAVDAKASDASAPGSAPGSLASAAGAAAAGVIVGAAGAWLTIRRRRMADESLPAAD